MTTALEADVLAVLRPGGLLTVDKIGHNLNVPPWRVVGALDSLRRNGDAFKNRRADWQIPAGQRRPDKQAVR